MGWRTGRRILGAAAAVVAVAALATGCVVPRIEPGDLGRGDVRAPASCPTPPGGVPFGAAAPEAVALDPDALGAAVQYATDRGAQSVRVYRHGCLVASGGHDWLTGTQRFPGWSMSKGVVATVVGRAVTLGLLRVDDPIGTHLDGLPPEVGALTVRHFLTQTSGLRMAWVNDLWAATNADSVADALARPFQAEPGSTFLYAQTAVTVLVAVVEAAAGEDFQAFADRELFRPIGIRRDHWHWQRDPSGRTQGFAFLEMAPVAWARLGHLLLRDGLWDGRRLLDAEYLAQAAEGTEANPGYGFLVWTNRGEWHLTAGFPDYQRKERRVWPGLPPDTFAYSGLFDQDVIVIPGLDMVVVRMGLPPELFGDPLGESPGLRPKYYWRFHRLLMSAVTDVEVHDPGPWVHEPEPDADPANIFEPTLPPFPAELPPWIAGAPTG